MTAQPPLTGVRVIELAGLAPGEALLLLLQTTRNHLTIFSQVHFVDNFSPLTVPQFSASTDPATSSTPTSLPRTSHPLC